MKPIICTTCPNGCELIIQADGTISGNKCKRGIDYAQAEMTCPMRTLTFNVRTAFPRAPVVSVRTAGEVPLRRIGELAEQLRQCKITERLPIGSVILKNALDSGTDIILTTNTLCE
jgi:CxxC motif-containing protein